MTGAAAADLALRALGGLIAAVAGLLTGVLVLVLVPVRLDTPFGLVQTPAAVILAIAGNLVLIWFARAAVGTRWAPLLPALGWLTPMAAALQRTREGSLLAVPDDPIFALAVFTGLATLTVGLIIALTAGPGPGPSRRGDQTTVTGPR